MQHLLDQLRYKSEGTGLDFKEKQYPFFLANDIAKSELLKDILALANSWRDGTGYIVLGFRERAPHPAEVVGITEQIDDAKLQQFVHGKVTPKLVFQYEEHFYQGKIVGLISIPKQPRPFFIGNAYGKIKSNVVYVRRGSSTAEADPIEAIGMSEADKGANIEISLLLKNRTGDALPNNFDLKFLSYSENFPDYAFPSEQRSLSTLSIGRANVNFWRELGESTKRSLAMIPIFFELVNKSALELTRAKLEVFVETLAGQSYDICASDRLPPVPEEDEASPFIPVLNRAPPDIVVRNDPRRGKFADIKFGSVIPGDCSCAAGFLTLIPSHPGNIRLRCRILAAEISAPIEYSYELEITGDSQILDFDGFRKKVINR